MNNPTKILFLLDAFHGGDRIGGTEGQVVQLLSHLDARRFEARIAVFRDTTCLKDRAALPCPVEVLDIAKLASPRTLVRLLRLSADLRRRNIDLVHIFLTDASVVAPLFCRLGGAQVIVSRRDMGFWYTPGTLRALRASNQFVNRMVTNSEAVKQNVHTHERYPLGGIDVVYNGHDPARFECAPTPGFRALYGIGTSDAIVGMVANLYPWKRQEDLLEAFVSVIVSHPRAHLMFVGTGPTRGALEQRASRLGLASRVHFTGGTLNAVPLIKHFTVGVLCSASEGLSNAVIEYMACGTPPVCTSVGGNPELVEHGVTGFLVAPGDIPALAERINRLLTDRELHQAMAVLGRRAALRLTSHRMAESHMSLYERLLCADTPPARDVASDGPLI